MCGVRNLWSRIRVATSSPMNLTTLDLDFNWGISFPHYPLHLLPFSPWDFTTSTTTITRCRHNGTSGLPYWPAMQCWPPDRPRALWPENRPSRSRRQRYTRQQTTDDDDRRPRAKQCWPVRRASNNNEHSCNAQNKMSSDMLRERN